MKNKIIQALRALILATVYLVRVMYILTVLALISFVLFVFIVSLPDIIFYWNIWK